MMSDFDVSSLHEGDVIRLVHENGTVIEGPVSDTEYRGNYWVAGLGVSYWIEVRGFEVEKVTAAPKPLPTEGWFTDDDQGDVWNFYKTPEGILRVERYALVDDHRAAELENEFGHTGADFRPLS